MMSSEWACRARGGGATMTTVDPHLLDGTGDSAAGGWRRRDALGALLGAATLPLMPRASAALPRVGIVGAGMAGVTLAWLLDGEFEVTLFEAQDSIGGNVKSVDLAVGGEPFIVDAGAQFFHPAPYPTYVKLLEFLGLYPPATAESHTFPASITVAAPGETTPRFVSPIVPTRLWPALVSWNQPALQAFATAFFVARARELAHAPWGLTLGDWLPTLGLPQAQWEGAILPWAASLFTGDIEQARNYSARAAMIFAAKALPANPADPLLYYVLERGMGEALTRMAAQFTTVQVLSGVPVTGISRVSPVGFTVHGGNGLDVAVDHLVMAASGPPTLALLQGVSGTVGQRAALAGIEFADATLMLHTDPVYAPGSAFFWSFLNCAVEGGFCEASMWLANVLTPPAQGSPPNLWKSWVTHRTQLPAQVLHEASYRHLVPTPASLLAQTALRARQGVGGIWFAGGYTLPYDSQETALLSAVSVALGLNPGGARLRALQG